MDSQRPTSSENPMDCPTSDLNDTHTNSKGVGRAHEPWNVSTSPNQSICDHRMPPLPVLQRRLPAPWRWLDMTMNAIHKSTKNSYFENQSQAGIMYCSTWTIYCCPEDVYKQSFPMLGTNYNFQEQTGSRVSISHKYSYGRLRTDHRNSYSSAWRSVKHALKTPTAG